MTSKVSIISNAFNILGEDSVNDLDTSALTQAASSLYDSLYRRILGCHSWTFCLEIGYELSKLSTASTVNEWTTIYQLPADYMNIYRVRPNTNFATVQNKIYTNQSNSLQVDYTKYTDEDQAPYFFTETMEYLVAAKCCMLVTSDKALTKEMQGIAQMRLNEARVLNDQMQPNPYIQSRPLVAAKLGAYSGVYNGG